MKKITGLLLVLALTLSLLTGIFSIPVIAKDANGDETTYDKLIAFEQKYDVEAIRAVLSEGFAACSSSIDLFGFGIELSDINGLKFLMYKDMPEAFHLQNSFSYSYGGDYLASLIPSYTMTAEEYASARAEFDARTAELVSGVAGNGSLTDVDKALILHDRLAVQTQYAYLPNGFPDSSEATAYSALVGRRSVCEGYTLAYIHLLRQVGIRSYYCDSTAMNHAWNLIFIGGKAYHTDVTWDSYVAYMTGYIIHDHFLLSSGGIGSDHVVPNTSDPAPDFELLPEDDTYEDDGYFWHNADSEIVLLNGEMYYVDSDLGRLIRVSDGAELLDIEGKWTIYEGGGLYYPGCYSRLVSYGGFLYYSAPQSVYRYDPATGTNEEIYNINQPEGINIYGFGYENNELIIEYYGEMLLDRTMPTDHQIRVPYAPPAPAVPELELSAISLTLYSDISFVAVADGALSVYDDLYAEFTVNSVTKTIDTYVEKNGKLRFSFNNIAPDMMTDDITVTLHGSLGGVDYDSDPLVYSIEQYCAAQISGAQDQELIDLLVDLLNYGAASQNYTGHSLGALADRSLTGAQKARALSPLRALENVSDAAVSTVGTPLLTWKTVGLNLRESVALYFVFDTDTTDGLELRITDTSNNLLAKLDSFSASGTSFKALFRKLNAGQMNKAVLVTAYRNGERISDTMRYSIESYAAIVAENNMEQLVPITTAMANYGISAAAFVAAHS